MIMSSPIMKFAKFFDGRRLGTGLKKFRKTSTVYRLYTICLPFTRPRKLNEKTTVYKWKRWELYQYHNGRRRAFVANTAVSICKVGLFLLIFSTSPCANDDPFCSSFAASPSAWGTSAHTKLLLLPLLFLRAIHGRPVSLYRCVPRTQVRAASDNRLHHVDTASRDA